MVLKYIKIWNFGGNRLFNSMLITQCNKFEVYYKTLYVNNSIFIFNVKKIKNKWKSSLQKMISIWIFLFNFFLNFQKRKKLKNKIDFHLIFFKIFFKGNHYFFFFRITTNQINLVWYCFFIYKINNIYLFFLWENDFIKKIVINLLNN